MPTANSLPLPVLAIPPKCVRFRHNRTPGLAELRQTLASQEATRPQRIGSIRDVLLASDGRVQGRYRFTTSGLRSFCQALSPGLSALAMDVSGLRQRQRTGQLVGGVQNVTVAAKLINDVVRLRFEEHLLGHHLVVDPRSGTIEGLVGPRYEFFSNLRLLELATVMFRDLSQPARFVAASLSGRRLLLRYLDSRNPIQLTETDKFYRGWSFSNSETGEAAIRVNGLVYRSNGAASAWEIGRCVHVHVSQRKLDRLQQRLGAAATEDFGAEWESPLRRLRETLLLLGASQERPQRVKTILGKLSRTVGRRVAQQAVQRLLGSLGETVVETPEARRNMAGLSCYHLYNSVASVASTLPPGEQERAEGLAHRILTGHLRF